MTDVTFHSSRAVAPRRIAGAVALTAIGVASAVLFAAVRSYALVGWDTLPEIATSRVDSLRSLLGTVTEATAEGYFPFGAMYRPLFNLSVALDYGLWGLAPRGWLLTGVLLYAATGLATWVLARRLLGPAAVVGAFAALATFLLLPAHAESVAIVSRRADVLCGLALALGVSAQVRRAARPMPGGALVPGLWTLAAAAAKEPGLVLAPVAVLVVLLVPSGPLMDRVRRAVGAAAVHAGAVAAVLLARVAAIGGLGGHPMADPAGAFHRLPVMLSREVLGLASLAHIVPVSSGFAWTLVALVGAAAAACVATLLRPGLPAAGRRVLATVAVSLAWLVAAAAVFGAAGLLQPWYLFAVAPAFGLLVGAVTEAALGATRRPPPAVRAAGALVLAVLVGWLAWQARWSPLLRRYEHWARASVITTRYLTTLRLEIDATRPGGVVRVAPPPHQIDADPGQPVTRHAMVLRPYSIQAWADLVFGEDRVLVRHVRAGPAPATGHARIVVLLDPRAARP